MAWAQRVSDSKVVRPLLDYEPHIGPGKGLFEGAQARMYDLLELHHAREISNRELREAIHWGLRETRGDYEELMEMLGVRRVDFKKFTDYLKRHGSYLDPKIFLELWTVH